MYQKKRDECMRTIAKKSSKLQELITVSVINLQAQEMSRIMVLGNNGGGKTKIGEIARREGPI